MKTIRCFNLLFTLILVTALLGFSQPAAAQAGGVPWASQFKVGGPQPVDYSTRATSTEPMSAEALAKFLPEMSPAAARVVAASQGIDTLWGKHIDLSQVEAQGMDNPVTTVNTWPEDNPSIAVNPYSESIVVVFSTFGTVRCRAQISYDGGVTFDWQDSYEPALLHGGKCINPSVRFSPDGQAVYYVYQEVYNSGSNSIALIQRASGGDPTVAFGGPTVVLNDLGVHFVDAPWGGVHTYDVGNAGVVYVTGTVLFNSGGCEILYNRSLNYGASWSYGVGYSIAGNATTCNPVLEGARPIGSLSNYMIICWYNSETDGLMVGKFDIRCRANNNKGDSGSWTSEFSAVDDKNYEVPYYMGPNHTNAVWAGTMYPVLATDPEGVIYIAFTADPTASRIDVESGNVFLTYNWPIPIGWKVPVAVGSGATTQGMQAVSARYDPVTKKYMVYVAYEDFTPKNVAYNVVYRRGMRAASVAGKLPAIAFGGKVPVSDMPSLNGVYIGSYLDSGLVARRYHVAWGDRADATSISDPDIDVLHDMFTP